MMGFLCYICNMNLIIGTENYQAEFNMNTIRSIMRDWGAEKFQDLQVSADIGAQMDFALLCAYHGINEAAAIRGEKATFILIADLGRKVTRFTELMPAMSAFTEAVSEFYKSDDEEGK